MASKRAKRAVTPPSAGKSKKRKGHDAGQPSIDSFFTSPNKSKAAESTGSVISISDSDSETLVKGRISSNTGNSPSPSPKVQTKNARPKSDEQIVRDLSSKWAKEVEAETADKGKRRSSERGIDDEAEDDVQILEPSHSEAPGVNGSSSSKHKLPPSPTPSKAPVVVKGNMTNGASPKPLASMFVKDEPRATPLREIKPDGDTIMEERKPTIPKTNGSITSVSAEAVEAIDFDTDAFLFRPEVIDVSKWPKGRLPYSVLVGVYVQVSSTRSRLLIVKVLTNFLRLLLHASPIDLPPALYLLSNHLLPSYLPCELGIGSQILSKAVQDVSGLQPRDLKKLWEKWGDPGDVAYEAKNNLRTLVRPSPLLVGEVYERMVGLSRIKGQQSGKIKGDVVRKLMVQARGEEMRFLVRSLVGNLRIGAVRLTLLTSLARATALFHTPSELLDSVRPIPLPPPKPTPGQKRAPRPKPQPDPARDEVEERCVEAVKLVRKVYVRHPNYGDLVRGLEAGGLEGLAERVPVSVGIPLSPMLGSITRSLSEVFTRLGTLPFTAEAKLDGQRVQIHVRRHGPQGEDDGGGRWVEDDEGQKVWVRLFSRHLEDMTEKYPDICHLTLNLLNRPLPNRAPFPSTASDPSPTALELLKLEKVDSLIMDAEVVAVDKDSGAYRTFQDLSNRAKKDVRVEEIKVVVAVFAFDLMLLNDEPLLSLPFSHRRHLLRTLFPPFADTSDPTLARFAHVENLDSLACSDVPSEMQTFFENVVEQKCEGLMVKLLESGEGLTGEDDDGDDVDDAGEGSESGGKRKKGGKGGGGKKKPLPATYEPDQRSQGWLKVKKDYLEGLGDSLDLVPIGAWWGQGRKAGWWSPILLACHNPETGALEAVCKCISGFTDQFYKDLLVRFPPHDVIPEKCSTGEPLSYCETNGLRPNVWFSPDEVWEIRGADITLSPVYPAAATLLGSERGLSIRFPRFMRLRDDKTWEQATTSDQFADMYRKQMRDAPARTTEAVEAVDVQVPDDGDDAEAAGSIANGDDEDDDDDAGSGAL